MEAEEKEILIEKAQRALDSIRPFLEADGGDIEVIDLTNEYELVVLMTGNCESCQMKESTLKGGVEGTIFSTVPEIKKVVAI
ncbi:MAG: NifU family protein [Chitinophagales bacterium]|nr:NifU family protein [Chitinophagales bacterium]MCZ2393908.1 NifU family protein [Chitinophagales bacterium]